MAEKNPIEAMKVPGRLVVSPTDLSIAFPYGGTSLGLIRDVVVRNNERDFEHKSEGRGGEVVDLPYMGEDWQIAFALRGWDSDAINSIFPNTTLSATTGERKVVYPGSLKVGQSKTQVSVIFAPEDADHPAVYFRKSIPRVARELEIETNRSSEFIIACIFQLIIDSANIDESVQIGLLEDITL